MISSLMWLIDAPHEVHGERSVETPLTMGFSPQEMTVRTPRVKQASWADNAIDRKSLEDAMLLIL